MDRERLKRRREAGLAFLCACEEVLGVSGPTALARMTGRDKSWWSRLGSGKGGPLPKWEEIAAVLPQDLSAETRLELQERHRRAWLLLHDPGLLEERAGRALVVPVEELWQLWLVSQQLGMREDREREALSTVRVLDRILSTVPPETLTPRARRLLIECLEDTAVYEINLGNPAAVLPAARRIAGLMKLSGDPVDEIGGRYAVALAHHRLRDWGRAVKEWLPLYRGYQRLGQPGGMARAMRDIGIAERWTGQYEAAEAHLLRSLEDAVGLTPDYRYPTLLYLADVALLRGRLEQSREWLARMNRMAERHPATVGGLASLSHIRANREQIERRLVEQEAQRKAGRTR